MIRSTAWLLVAGGMCLTGSLFADSLREIRIDRHQAVPMRDGVRLYADVYRPAAEGRWPTLVVRTPYGVQRDGVHAAMIRFAQNGYAVLIQDVRGRYESEGKWDPFRHEAEDGYDTIEWAARQPWSNGKVATQGGSYLGHVQWRAASLKPPHLVAAFGGRLYEYLCELDCAGRGLPPVVQLWMGRGADAGSHYVAAILAHRSVLARRVAV